jgi:hypothetical protein
MANWIIRSNALSVSVENTRIILRSKRHVSIKPGDELVLLSSGWVFTHTARVLDISAGSTTLRPNEQKNWWELHIERWDPLPREVELDDVSTSLTFVRNWKRPKVHVRQAYRRLPDDDLETIKRGDIFLARDAYLTLIAALPPRLGQYFLAERSPASAQSRSIVDYAERAVALIRFIDERVLSVGKVVLAAQDQWDILSTRIGSPKGQALYVWDENEMATPATNLTLQAQAFRTLLPETTEESGVQRPSLSEIAELLTSPARQDVERRFERVFRSHGDE